ncbi:type IV secretion system protein VirB10 [Bordetella pseudohinzii]|uniref:Type IV secretion system protein virB10 n=3 Tax=Bordetella pseudohinzii TaxID=1331258 RepID=A0A0J6C733_9BORD|nr:type IV secretion system protein VirB10 [Bordetella pseudohinzii]KMM26928.1 Type IV secretion system protein PtlH [Bordetella pseudohinzii]KXA76222.1 hypothetical protein AW877_17370 [Bordetella pseudohinzii]KXA78124.1 hypothetical protein AW878_13635 [Bordetella pseudohinzii]CUI59596.1 Type IV secretion system protein virB10 [Bordetella pseudohinzii]
MEPDIPGAENRLGRGAPRFAQAPAAPRRLVLACLLAALLILAAGLLWKRWLAPVSAPAAGASLALPLTGHRVFAASEAMAPAVIEPAPPPPAPAPEPPWYPEPDMPVLPQRRGQPFKDGATMMIKETPPQAQWRGEPVQEGASPDALQAQARPSRAARVRDRDAVLLPGSYIECVLQTRLDTTVSGMATCRVTQDVYSASGRRVVIPRGAMVTGRYAAGLAQGVSRIYVLWNRLITPAGVTVALDSPAIDALGASGLPGVVDTHFAQRFGAALLFSVMGDAASQLLRPRNDATVTVQTSGAVNTLAAEVLRHSINIPATLRKNPGERVGIMVAREIDFSGVIHE